MTEDVLIRTEGALGRISLNRPRALNALTVGMCLAISEALLAWARDDRIACVLIDHEGERGFCAGGDVRRAAESGAGDGVDARRFFHAEYRMNELLHRYPKPTVAFMDGITMGGGVGLSLPLKARVATEKTMWAMPEGDIGLFPDVGGGWTLPRLPGFTGTWLALTGSRLGAAECRALGIATHFSRSHRLEDFRDALRRGQVPAASPGAAPDELVARTQGPFSCDTVEAILAALDQEGSEWATEQAQAIRRKCPTTQKVALRLLREGAGRASFAEEMQVEYRLAVRMTRRHDFIDGVRAVLVDKDNAPRWQPPRLEEVTQAQLDALFAPFQQAEVSELFA